MNGAPCQALLPNTLGHDYFVGDVHGHFSRLQAALDARGFDPRVDRLIIVGDLVDRGPESPQALEWLARPYVQVIRGNHEALFLMWYALRTNAPAQVMFENDSYFPSGGRWADALTPDEQAQYAQAFERLPYMLIVPYNGRTIGVVHAEVPEGAQWPALLPQCDDKEVQKTLLWGRTQWKACRAEEGEGPWVSGLDAVVVGHSPMPQPMPWGNMLFLDTGAWCQDHPFWVLRADEVLALIDGELDPTEWACPSYAMEASFTHR